MEECYAEQLRAHIHEFNPISDKAWAHLQELFRYEHLKKGDFFARKGEIQKEVAFVAKGILRTYYVDEQDNEYNRTFIVENRFSAPIRSIIRKEKNDTNIQALEETVLLVANYYQIEKLLDDHHDLERFVRKFFELAWCEREQKEIQFLSMLAEKRYEIFRNTFPGLENRIPQYQVASYLGITPTQLSRIRSTLSGK